MKPSILRTPIALALALLATAGAAQAQSIQDGTSNTIGIGDGSVRPVRPLLPVRGAEPAGTSLTTRATVNGNISQSNTTVGGGAGGSQTASIGGVRNAAVLGGNIETNGTLSATLSQSRRDAARPANQEVNIGGVAGSLVVRGDARLNGVALGAINQTAEGGGSLSGNARQSIDIGGARDFTGGSLTTVGTVLSTVTQTQRGFTDQQLRVGSASGNVDEAVTNGLVQGSLLQSSTVGSGSPGAAGSNLQRIDVGAIGGSQAQAVRTNGQLLGAVAQTQQAGAVQAIEVGAVNAVDGAGRIDATGTVVGDLTQNATAAGNQRVAVGAVRGGAPRSASARGTLVGSLVQTNNAPGLSPQLVAIGSIDDSTGDTSTDATVTGAVTQTLNANANSSAQTLTVGSASGTGGTVATRATLTGNVTQNAISAGSRQTINVGSVVGTRANVRTDVAVTGNLSQFSNGAGQTQTILIGGVVGAADETITE